MPDIDELLDDRMTSGSGDYPPWMNETDDDGNPIGPVQDEGDVLQGLVVGIRDDPFHDPSEDDGDPAPILHVRDESGDEWSTRTHSILVNLINDQDVEVGDYIRIRHSGQFKTEGGQVANDYEIGVIKAEELDDVGMTEMAANSAESASTTQEPSTETTEPEPSTTEGDGPALDPNEGTVEDVRALVSSTDDVSELEAMFEAEMTGKDRKTVKQLIKERKDELEGTDEESVEEAPDIPGEAVEFAESLLSFHGEIEVEELDQYLNETRDFGIAPEDIVQVMDAEIDGDVVRPTE